MTATAGSRLMVRVTVGDTWTATAIEASPEERVAVLKSRALAISSIAAAEAARYEVKAGGALVRDETRTLAEIGVRNGGSLMVLAKRRRPVR